jgi:glycosyltransferase involved in cell wall biosynthesis
LPSQQNIIYDITDDWAEFAQSARQLKLVQEDDDWATVKAEAVIVCSEKLYEKKKGKNEHLSLIRNGVDHMRYHPEQLRGVEAASDIAMLKRPIAGYTGTLHDQRLDLVLIREVAALLPQVNLVFVGPNGLSADQTKQLTALPNIHILGTKSYQDLPQYIAAFDLCITPHKVSAFTESLDPLKLYEYMSTGKPIVSTACAGFRELEPLVRIAGTSKAFAAAIMQALEFSPGDAESREQRLSWGASCSWSERVKEVERVLGW